MHRFYFQKLRDVTTPSRSYAASAGWDFYIPNSFVLAQFAKLSNYRTETDWETKVIPPQRALFIPSGLRIQMQKGWALRFENRSSMALKGLLVGATIVDQDYQGEVHLHLWNVSQDDIVVKAGQKIVQGIFFQTHEIQLAESNQLFTSTSSRGSNGFGSSDKVNQQQRAREDQAHT